MLENINNCITYRPIKGEIDPFDIPNLKNHLFEDIYLLPTQSITSPVKIAQEVANRFGTRSVCILIPGTRFDRFGTRHGRGNGWFDRFLDAVPKEWIRIGITDLTHFSPISLIRKSWDQPVDWIICKQNSSWEVIETHARDISKSSRLSDR